MHAEKDAGGRSAVRTALVVVAGALHFGCGDAPATDTRAGSADTAAAIVDAGGASPGDASSFSLPTDTFILAPDGIMERVEIPFTYHNAGSDPLYHPTCRPSGGPPTVAIALQRPVDGTWMEVWSQPLPACLSEPIVIGPGERFSDSLEVRLHPQDSVRDFHLVPGSDLEGPFRLVWHQLLTTYDPASQPFGKDLPLNERVSPPFVLRRR